MSEPEFIKKCHELDNANELAALKAENERLKNNLTEFKMLCDALKLENQELLEQIPAVLAHGIHVACLNARLIAMCRMLEWGTDDSPCCPVCHSILEMPHAQDCPLYALLKDCEVGR